MKNKETTEYKGLHIHKSDGFYFILSEEGYKIDVYRKLKNAKQFVDNFMSQETIYGV